MDERETRLDKPTLSRDAHLASIVVFVDGITRSGKSLLGPILSSFKRVEIERLEWSIEYVGSLHKLGKLSHDAAVVMLRTVTDLYLYNSMIGRDTNFRFSDHSGVWNSSNRLSYFRRLFLSEGKVALERDPKGAPIFQNQTHDQLANIDLHLAAFGPRLRVVEVIRHPVDLVDSWMRRGWGTRFGSDALAFTLCLRHEEQDLPYYAAGWEKEYVAASPLGRVIRVIGSLWDDNQAAYLSLSDELKEQVLFVPLEEITTEPLPYIEGLARFLGTEVSKKTAKALKRERCPRGYSVKARDDRWDQIKAKASQDEIAIMEHLIFEYKELVDQVSRA